MSKLNPGTKVLVTFGDYAKDFAEGTVTAHSVKHQKVRVAFPLDTDDYTFPEDCIIVIGK